jgi:deoxycytidylate deaminase
MIPIMTKADIRMLELARRISQKADYYQKVGCVVAKKSRVLGMGYNHPQKTHPKATTPFQTIHAELSASLGISFDEIRGATAYVARLSHDGNDALAMPCSHCMAMLRSLFVKKVVFTRTGQEPGILFL